MTIHGLYDNNLYPARFGGAERIYRLYRHLARRAEVTVLSLLRSRERAPRSERVQGIQLERRKPVYPTLLHYGERLRLWPTYLSFHLHRALGRRFAWHFRDPGAVYQFDSFLLTALYARVPRGALKVYHAVNVEIDWYEPLLRSLPRRRRWERSLRAIEAHALEGADLILVVSERDAERLASEYGAPRDRMLLVPNGFDPERFAPVVRHAGEQCGDGWAGEEGREPSREALAARARLRASLGFEPGHRVAVFTGSAMSHNLEAAEFLARHLAPACAARQPELRFLLVGDLARGPLPLNMRAVGTVDEVPPYLAASDVALNPVLSGSGSSLKVPEYLAAGLPVVSTPFGMRGFEDLSDCVTLCERPEMERALADPRPLPAGMAARLAPYTWEAQADKLFRAYRAWTDDPREAPRQWASIA